MDLLDHLGVILTAEERSFIQIKFNEGEEW